MITGNKGEWSEIYALFKLLGEGKVHQGDAELRKLPLYYPVLSVIRKELIDREYKPNTNQQLVIITEEGKEVLRIPMERFINEARNLLESIHDVGKGKGAFALPRTEAFMREVRCERLKAASREKADIHIVLHDSRTCADHLLGFSIKSQLGSPSTLLNAGETTNFLYEVTGIDAKLAAELNLINEHCARISEIYKRGGKLRFCNVENETFNDNLTLIDSLLPQIIAECLITDSLMAGDLKTIVKEVSDQNALGISHKNTHVFFEYKMKQLLLAAALGMTPAKEWVGKFDANGGYIVIRKDGEIICYHFYNQNDVEDYLFNNTKFERASRTRYHFGTLFESEGKMFIRLNLQIRFKI